jgi:hypothetical protein
MKSLLDPELPDTGECVVFAELVARFFEVEPRAAVPVEFGALSHPGLVRDVNEEHDRVVRRRRLRDMLLSNLPVELLDQAEQETDTLAVADGSGAMPSANWPASWRCVRPGTLAARRSNGPSR